MSDATWHRLIDDFLQRRIDEPTFHDRFFDLWHGASATGWTEGIPPPIDKLFYVVEAYCPDPELRNPDSGYEADERELREAAEQALREFAASQCP